MPNSIDPGSLFALPAPSPALALRATRQALDATEAALDLVKTLGASAARLGAAAEALRAAHPAGGRVVDDLCSSAASVQRIAARVVEATCSAGVRVSALGLVVSARAMADEAAGLAEGGAA